MNLHLIILATCEGAKLNVGSASRISGPRCLILFVWRRCLNLLELAAIPSASVFASDTTNLPLDHVRLPQSLAKRTLRASGSELKTLIAL